MLLLKILSYYSKAHASPECLKMISKTSLKIKVEFFEILD